MNWIEKRTKEGRAYGFFYSSASEDEIRDYMPLARERASIPSNIEVRFHKGINPQEFYPGGEHNDSRLSHLAELAIQDGNNYTMIATLPFSTNEYTAGELGNLLNEFYQSPLQDKFLKDDGKFYGGIVYEENGEFLFRE